MAQRNLSFASRLPSGIAEPPSMNQKLTGRGVCTRLPDWSIRHCGRLYVATGFVLRCLATLTIRDGHHRPNVSGLFSPTRNPRRCLPAVLVGTPKVGRRGTFPRVPIVCTCTIHTLPWACPSNPLAMPARCSYPAAQVLFPRDRRCSTATLPTSRFPFAVHAPYPNAISRLPRPRPVLAQQVG
jgi:hypothetical protein